MTSFLPYRSMYYALRNNYIKQKWPYITKLQKILRASTVQVYVLVQINKALTNTCFKPRSCGKIMIIDDDDDDDKKWTLIHTENRITSTEINSMIIV